MCYQKLIEIYGTRWSLKKKSTVLLFSILFLVCSICILREKRDFLKSREPEKSGRFIGFVPDPILDVTLSADIPLLDALGDNAVLSFVPQLRVVAYPFTAVVFGVYFRILRVWVKGQRRKKREIECALIYSKMIVFTVSWRTKSITSALNCSKD